MAHPPLPDPFAERMQHQLGADWNELATKLDTLAPTSIRWNKSKTGENIRKDQPVPWCSQGQYLTSRPNFALDPDWHAGRYYVQEAASMFLEWLWQQLPLTDRPLAVLDLCAAPGGKTTHLADLLPDGSLIVANEVIKSRVSVLEENVVKWGYPQSIITSADPDRWKQLGGLFDVVLVDAPCSGEGLFRKEPESRLEWSPDNVKHCSARQYRILEAATQLVKPGGFLIYSTCTWSEDEDEAQLDFAMEHGFAPIETGEAPFDVESTTSKKGATGYRLYPHRTKGEGFFIGALQKKYNAASTSNARPRIFEPYSDQSLKTKFLSQPDSFELVSWKGNITAIPSNWKNLIEGIAGAVPLRLAGIRIGQMKGKDLVPHPFLAFSTELGEPYPSIDLQEPEHARRFLAKLDFDTPDKPDPGWHLVRYRGNGLGWVKVLPNRINNYYPTHWRLRQTF